MSYYPLSPRVNHDSSLLSLFEDVKLPKKITMINPVSLINLIKDLKITIFLWFPYISMVFLWFSYGFPMVSLWFSYGFPMVSFSFSFGKPLSPSPRAPCPGHRPKYSAARPRNQRCNPSAAPADGHRDRDRQVFTRCLVCKGSC